MSLQVRGRGCQELVLALGNGCRGDTGHCEPRAQDFGFVYQPFVPTCPSCCGPASLPHHLGEGDSTATVLWVPLPPAGLPQGSPSIRPHKSWAAEGSERCWEAPWYGRTIS